MTAVDANRNRREAKSSPLQPGAEEAAASTPAEPAAAKSASIQQQTRESGDGASSAGPDVIESEAEVPPSEGRRVLSTARNGSLFDDDEEAEALATDASCTGSAAASSASPTAATSSNSETKVNSTRSVE